MGVLCRPALSAVEAGDYQQWLTDRFVAVNGLLVLICLELSQGFPHSERPVAATCARRDQLVI